MIKIKNLAISGPMMLAPIAGYTDSPFRIVARSHGAALTVTELVSAEGIVRRIKKSMDFLRFRESERPLAVQIFGNNPRSMAEAARYVESLNPDLIDINMGCPAPKVCRGGEGSGSALLRDTEKVFAIAESVVKAVSVPVSAKIRIGWDRDHMNYREVVRALEAAGIALIFVHGRTVSQKYSGKADWDVIREICGMTPVPVVGNGDIMSYQEGMDRMRESGCPAVMIGRGSLGNPWIFSGVKPSWQQVVAQMKNHLDLMIEFYGEYGIIIMRKHIVKYIHGFRNASKWREKLIRVSRKDEVYHLLDSLSQIDEVRE